MPLVDFQGLRVQVFNENVHEVAVGRDYRIDFRSGDLGLSLHIRLGKNFPAERPEVHVEPPVLHPWVDPLGKVDSPGLRQVKNKMLPRIRNIQYCYRTLPLILSGRKNKMCPFFVKMCQLLLFILYSFSSDLLETFLTVNLYPPRKFVNCLGVFSCAHSSAHVFVQNKQIS